MGEPSIGRGRRPVAHYLGLTAIVVAVVVIIVALT